MDIVPIPGSSVPCERVFSSAKETTTARRNRITPELMEALQMMKYTVKHGRRFDFTAGDFWKEQELDLELLMEQEIGVSEDVREFGEGLLSKGTCTG